MNSPDLKYISLADASLEPIDAESADKAKAPAAPAEPVANKGPSTFHPNTRDHVKSDRRLEAERRVELRYQEGRRKGVDRRPKKSWDPGNNL